MLRLHIPYKRMVNQLTKQNLKQIAKFIHVFKKEAKISGVTQ